MADAKEPGLKSQVVKSEVHLDVRDGDKPISGKELGQFDLFRRMKKPISVEKLPGSIVLRRYRQGEVIFQQGQAGGTAFYIPTAEDLARMRSLEVGEEAPAASSENRSPRRQILTAMIVPSTRKSKPQGFLQRLFAPAAKTPAPNITAIPGDVPTDIDRATFKAPMMEGELFGEMSCISYMPRSATVIACVDCELLEFNRNVFDQLSADPNHQASVDAEYRRRALNTHLRQFELFQGLTDSQIQFLKDNVSLEIVEPGKVICEEGDSWSDEKPLDVFIVRNGVVQVTVNTNLSLRMDDIRDWTGICQQLAESRPVAPAVETASKPQPAVAVATSASPVAKKGGPQEMLAAMRAKKLAAAGAESSGTEAPPSEPAPAAETPAAAPAAAPKKPNPQEMLAAMRAKKLAAAGAELPGTDAPPTQSAPAAETPAAVPAAAPKKPNPQEMLAAMRAKKLAAAGAEAPGTDAPPTEPAPAAETPAAAPAAAPKKPNPQEMLAAMRAKKLAAASAESSGTDAPPTEPALAAETPAAVPAAAPKKPNPQEMLAAMRAKKLAAAGAESSGTEAPPTEPAPAAETPAAVPAAAPKKPNPQEILAAMRNKQGATPSANPKPAAESKLATSRPVELTLKPEAGVARPQEIALIRESRSKETGPAAFVVYSWLSAPVQNIVKRGAGGEALADTDKSVILSALNALAGSRKFLQEDCVAKSLEHPEILRKAASFPKGLKGIAKDWSELELRTAGRAVLSELFPELIRKPIEAAGPPRVLAYMSRGDCIGEIAVINRTPRSATCIAYNHPSSESARDFGHVELVRIPGSAFRQLMDDSPELKTRVEALAAKRIQRSQAAESRRTESDLVASTEFQQMGLFQGTKLLVIDLDSCTRCGDCVEACISTHDDGYSRLFLDGPRYDRFLVPSACRNCLNPVCMIGCPVGSIGRGDNGQIEIYDWCIGCSACADQCPYDSIQMHDLGLIPEESLGWLYADRRSLPDDWQGTRRLGSGWRQGKSPFRWQGDFLRSWSAALSETSSESPLHLCFRHEFRLPASSPSRSFRLSINDDRRKSAVEKIRVKKTKVAGAWLNGKPLNWSGNSIDLAKEEFARANNVIAIEVIVENPAEYGQFILSASLDAVPEAGAQVLDVLGTEVRAEMDLVTRRAAVCDLCSHTPSQQPACVSSCPHDAAIRINPLVNFPV